MKIFTKNTSCISNEDFILYKKDLLDENQRFEIENHALDCSLCADALDGLSELEMKDLKANMNALDEKIKNAIESHKTKQNKNANIFNLIAKVAAVFVGLAILSIGIMQYIGVNKQETIFSQNFDAEKFSTTRRTAGIDKSDFSTFERGIEAYNSENYVLALELFEKAIANGESVNKYDPYLKAGITALKLDQLEMAEDYLMQVRINDNFQQDQATWYLALTAIKLKENKKAVAFLNELTHKNGKFNKKATALIQQLK